MACPSIGSQVGGIPEAIDHGETGFLVPPENPAALAARLRILLSDPALRHRFGAAGRRKMQAQFDLGKQTARLETIYDALTGDTA